MAFDSWNTYDSWNRNGSSCIDKRKHAQKENGL